VAIPYFCSIFLGNSKFNTTLSEAYAQLSDIVDPSLAETCRLIGQTQSNIRFYDEEFALLQRQNFQMILKEIILYTENALKFLQRRDERQQDFEEISAYMKELKSKRDVLKNNLESTIGEGGLWKRFMGGSAEEPNPSDKLSHVDAKLQEVDAIFYLSMYYIHY